MLFGALVLEREETENVSLDDGLMRRFFFLCYFLIFVVYLFTSESLAVVCECFISRIVMWFLCRCEKGPPVSPGTLRRLGSVTFFFFLHVLQHLLTHSQWKPNPLPCAPENRPALSCSLCSRLYSSLDFGASGLCAPLGSS